MKLFNEWLSSQDQPVKVIGEPAGLNAYLLPSGIGLEDVFKAGMLAAADIAWDKGSLSGVDDYYAGKEQASEDIREAANETN